MLFQQSWQLTRHSWWYGFWSVWNRGFDAIGRKGTSRFWKRKYISRLLNIRHYLHKNYDWNGWCRWVADSLEVKKRKTKKTGNHCFTINRSLNFSLLSVYIFFFLFCNFVHCYIGLLWSGYRKYILRPDVLPDANLFCLPGLGTGTDLGWIAHSGVRFLVQCNVVF